MAVQELHPSTALGESMLEEIRRTAEHRLRQIEPLIEEAHRLRDVLEVLEQSSPVTRSGADTVEAGYPSGAQRGGGANGNGHDGRPAAASAKPRAAKGSNKRIILELVGNKPGITAAQISELTGMKRTVAASTVSRLKRHGELREHEQGGVRLPGPSVHLV